MANVPEYWLMPPPVMPTSAGMHRMTWDLRYPDPPTLNYGYNGTLLDYREYTLNWHATPGQRRARRSSARWWCRARIRRSSPSMAEALRRPSRSSPIRAFMFRAGELEAQFRLQQRMVAGSP